MRVHAGTHHDHIKKVISLLIVIVAFGIFLIFNAYSEDIIASNNFSLFMTLAVVGSGLLVALLYLVNNSKHVAHKVHAVKSVKGKSKKK